MRRPLALAALVLGAATPTSAGAEPHTTTGAASLRPLELPVERRGLDGGGSLVTSTTGGAASLAVCVAPGRPRVEPRADALEVERRGGEITVERRGDASIWCVTLPRTELPFALWLAGRRAGAASPEPSGPDTNAPPAPADQVDASRRRGDVREADTASLDRLLQLSLEGEASASTSRSAPGYVVTVVSDAAPAEVAALATRYVSRVTEAAPRALAPWTLHQSTERLSVIEANLSAPFVRWGWAVPSSSPDRAATLAIALDLLGGDRGARVPRLVQVRAVARRGAAWLERLPGGALGGVWLELSTRVSIDRARRFIDGTLKQLGLVGPSAREVRRAHAHLSTENLRRWEDVAERARGLAWYELSLGGGDAWPAEIRALGAVTPEAVRRLAREHFVDARRTTVEVYPPLFQPDDARVATHQLYTVAAGDTLASVAERFHVSLASLARANDVDPRYGLTVGQPLWIPPD